MTQPVSLPEYENPTALVRLVESALAETARLGASAAAVSVGANSGLSVSVRLGEVETVEHHRGKQLGVTVYFGNKTGSATTTDLDRKAINDAVGAACRIARYTEDDEYAGLADADRMAADIPDLKLFHPWAIDAGEAGALAQRIESAARKHDKRITNSDGAAVNSFQGCHVYANSHGFLGAYAATRHSASCAVIAESDGEMQRDYWQTVARNSNNLEAGTAVGERAAKRTLQRLGAQRLSSRTVPVIFEAETAKRLFGSFVSAISGGALYRKATFLVDRLGDRIFSDIVNIRDEPHLDGALGSSPFDSEGVATSRTELVSGGVLESYVLDSYAGRRLNMPSTGHAGGVNNLIIEPGPNNLDALISEMGTGVLITELMGQGVNILTGDYSRGIAGFWVENGTIQFPVEELTAASTLQDMFMGIQGIGSDVDERSSIRSGSVLIDHMTIAGD